MSNRDHYFDASIGDGSYDLEYLEAVLTEDHEEVERIEDAAIQMGYGPKAECHTIANFTTQKLHCRKGISWFFQGLQSIDYFYPKHATIVTQEGTF